MAEQYAIEAPRVSVPTGPTGIAGWLILMAIGQVLGPLKALVNVGNTYSDKNMVLAFQKFPLAMWGTLVFDLAALVFVFATAIVFLVEKNIQGHVHGRSVRDAHCLSASTFVDVSYDGVARQPIPQSGAYRSVARRVYRRPNLGCLCMVLETGEEYIRQLNTMMRTFITIALLMITIPLGTRYVFGQTPLNHGYLVPPGTPFNSYGEPYSRSLVTMPQWQRNKVANSMAWIKAHMGHPEAWCSRATPPPSSEVGGYNAAPLSERVAYGQYTRTYPLTWDQWTRMKKGGFW